MKSSAVQTEGDTDTDPEEKEETEPELLVVNNQENTPPETMQPAMPEDPIQIEVESQREIDTVAKIQSESDEEDNMTEMERVQSESELDSLGELSMSDIDLSSSFLSDSLQIDYEEISKDETPINMNEGFASDPLSNETPANKTPATDMEENTQVSSGKLAPQQEGIPQGDGQFDEIPSNKRNSTFLSPLSKRVSRDSKGSEAKVRDRNEFHH